MAENTANKATYKGFGVVLQEDNKKEALTGFNFSDVSSLLDCLKMVLTTNDYYYLIKHDRDIQETGELKRPHYHIVFDFMHKKSKKNLLEELTKVLQVNKDSISIEPLQNMEGAVRYLLHLDHPNKAKYNDFEIRTNDTKIDRYLKGMEGWIIDAMKQSNTIIDFTDIVGLDLGNKYQNLAQKFIRDKGAVSRQELIELNSIIWSILAVVKNPRYEDKEKVNKISKLLTDITNGEDYTKLS